MGAQGGVRIDGHVVKRLFPLAGGGGGGDLFRGDGDQLAALLCGNDALARALGQPHIDEPLDGGGARGGRAEAGGLHALAQFLVLQFLPGVLHQGEQRGVVEPLRGLGLLFAGADLPRRAHFALAHVRQGRGRLLLHRRKHGAPAHVHRHGPVGAEFVAAHHDAQARRFVGIVRVMGGDEAARHQVVQRFLIRRHRPGAALGGDDGVVVGDFRGVVKAFGIHMGIERRGLEQGMVAGRQVAQGVQRLFAHVRRQAAAVRARVGDGLVALVEGLRQLQRLVRGKTEAAVGLALQGGEVEKLRRGHALALAAALDHRSFLALRLALYFVGLLLAGSAALARLRVVVQALEVAKVGAHFPVVLGNELGDLAVALYQQRQGRRLHAAHGQKRPVAQREGARGVHAHQPVGQTAAAGAFVKRVVVGGGAQFLKALADGRVGHRGDPQPPNRLFAARHAVDVAEDQFALARRVGCADDLGGVLVVHQLFDDGELAARGGQHL